MDTIIGWLASIAAILLIAGAIYTLHWSQPHLLENWKIKWSLLAGGGFIVLVLITSSFNALFGSLHEGAANAEPRSWYRIKPMPSEADIRETLTFATNRYAQRIETPSDAVALNRRIGCDLWSNPINYKTKKNDGNAEGKIVLRWLGACRAGKVHGTDTLLLLLPGSRYRELVEASRVQLTVNAGVIANERDYREAWANAIIKRTQQKYARDVATVLAGQRNYATYLFFSFMIIGVGVALSYAAAAGRWNNANFVQFSDWWGFPTLFAIGVTQMWHYMFSLAAIPPAWIAAEQPALILMVTGIMFIAAIPCALLYIVHVFTSLRALPQIAWGIAVLSHCFFYRHPVEAVMPDDPFARVDRKVLRKALMDAACSDRSWFKSLITPSFVDEHRMFAGARVEDMFARHADFIRAALLQRRLSAA
ncbi:MAG: hypothetical protein ABL907_16095 [Hyphomicrobium sp.]